MMKKILSFFAVIGVIMCFSCDNYSLDGTWICYETDGVNNPMKFVISGNQLSVYQDINTENVLAYKGIITYNNSVCPKHMDITITDTMYTEYIGKTSLGIYKIEGTTLILCNEEPGNGLRPTTFTSEGNPRLFVMTKAKE